MTPARVKPLPELALAVVLIVAPFVLPRIGGSLDMLQRILDWGLIGLGFDLLFGVVQFFFGCPIRFCHQENPIYEGNNTQCLPVLTYRWAI